MTCVPEATWATDHHACFTLETQGSIAESSWCCVEHARYFDTRMKPMSCFLKPSLAQWADKPERKKKRASKSDRSQTSLSDERTSNEKTGEDKR